MRALPVVTCLLIALGVVPAASAEVWRAGDPGHDVAAIIHYPGPAPCGSDVATEDDQPARRDIRRLGVNHRADSIELTLSMDEVKRGDYTTSYALHLRAKGGHEWSVEVSGQGGTEPLYAVLVRERKNDSTDQCGDVIANQDEKRCGGLAARADPRQDRITVSLPRECVGHPDWVRAGADVTGFLFSDGHGAYSISTDSWSPAGTTGPHPYGPRVASG